MQKARQRSRCIVLSFSVYLFSRGFWRQTLQTHHHCLCIWNEMHEPEASPERTPCTYSESNCFNHYHCCLSLSAPSPDYFFNRGHFRFCHTHLTANALQSTFKYCINIYFPSSGGIRLPDHKKSDQISGRSSGAGFLTTVRATFLRRHETTLGKYSTSPQCFSS